jgi:hypothetical protein
MAQITTYTLLYPSVLRWLPGCELQFILLELQKAARHICENYDFWVEDLDPILAVNYQQDYTLAAPSADPANTPTTYSAFIHRLKEVKVNGIVYSEPMYNLVSGTILRFDPLSVPNNLDDMLLVCGTAGSTTVADWNAVINAYLGITINDSAYDVACATFAGLTFPQIALAIQTALRAEVDSNVGFCRWFTNKFKLWVESGEISYLTAGSAGTDISGASWCNGLTGGTGVSLGGLIQVKAVLVPHQSVDTLPDWLMDKLSNTLVARAINQLKLQPGPYYDEKGAGIWDTAYNIQLNNALGDARRDYKETPEDFEG